MIAVTTSAPAERAGCRRCVSACVDGPIGEHRKNCGCFCAAAGCAHAASDEVQARVTDQQRMIRRWRQTWHPPLAFSARVHLPSKRTDLRERARWWELEAQRGYPRSDLAREYGTNLRWLVELLDAGVDINRPFSELVRERGGR